MQSLVQKRAPEWQLKSQHLGSALPEFKETEASFHGLVIVGWFFFFFVAESSGNPPLVFSAPNENSFSLTDVELNWARFLVVFPLVRSMHASVPKNPRLPDKLSFSFPSNPETGEREKPILSLISMCGWSVDYILAAVAAIGEQMVLFCVPF